MKTKSLLVGIGALLGVAVGLWLGRAMWHVHRQLVAVPAGYCSVRFQAIMKSGLSMECLFQGDICIAEPRIDIAPTVLAGFAPDQVS